MRKILAILLLLTLSTQALAAIKRADPAYLATIEDDDPLRLPRNLASQEINLPPISLPDQPFAAPAGPVRAQAEYEASQGILIRWGSYNALQTEMVVPLTTATPPSDVWVVVSGSSQQGSASGVLSAGGADMEHVHFVVASTDSVWMRDYGPRFINDSGRRAIVDHTYNRPRPNDNLFPSNYGAQIGEPVYALPLVHGGGNFHLFGNRDAWMTRLVVNENPALSEQQITNYFAAYEGLAVTLTDPFPSSYDSTQHIDMWMLPLEDHKVIIGEYAAGEGGGVPKTVTDATTAQMQALGYTVLRTPGWRSGGTHNTYTNSMVVNQVALICRFNGQDARNAAALATYQSALPGHDIVAVDCSSIITQAGAIHCIVMHVPDLLFRDEFDPAG